MVSLRTPSLIFYTPKNSGRIFVSSDELKRSSDLIIKKRVVKCRKKAVWRQFLCLCGLQNELECLYQGIVVLDYLNQFITHADLLPS